MFLRLTISLIFLQLTACAALNSTPPHVTDQVQLQAQQQAMQNAALEKNLQLTEKVHGLMWPILRANHELCDENNLGMGLIAGDLARLSELAKLPKDTLTRLGHEKGIHVIYSVPNSPAGLAHLQRGDQILAINQQPLAKDITDKDFDRQLQKAADQGSLKLLIKRGDTDATEFALVPEPVCKIKLALSLSGDINASAGTNSIQFNVGLLERINNERLIQFVAAHELAHYSQHHASKFMRNLLVTGGIIYAPILYAAGSAFDLAVGILPIPKPDESLARYAVGKVTPYSIDFEREADYIGAYMLARAGVSLEEIETVFKTLALSSPKSTYLTALSHPAPYERLLTTQATLKEISAKQASGEALLPNGFSPPKNKPANK